MKALFLCLILSTFLLSKDAIYFMPFDAAPALQRITSELKNAKSNVYIAIYSFTNREIAKAIRDSAKNGVKYTIIFDEQSNIDNDKSQIGYLAKLKNIRVCTLRGKNKNGKYDGIMHNKLALIDNRLVILGSANWSKSAFEINYENVLVSSNLDYINGVKKYMNEMARYCRAF